MVGLYIPGVSAPTEVKDQLTALSKNIDFTREDVKAGNGMVFFGVNKVTGREVAVKFYYWGGDQAYHAEPKQLSAVRSPNVLEILDAGLLNNDWAYFLTPTCNGGDLDDVLERTSIGNIAAVDYTAQILNGLSQLHAQRFLHRDLKPANIYVNADPAAVIGDFGSVKKLPEGQQSIPASRHSVLYRPPETFAHGVYGITGDIYQTGIILYQLLGGYLPYEDTAYLDKRQLAHLKTIANPADQCSFVDHCMAGLINSGKLLKFNSLPPWVSSELRRLIKKACNVDPSKRFQSTAAFMAKLHELRPTTQDWRIDGGIPVLMGVTSFRVIAEGGKYLVQKRKDGPWRNDNSFHSQTFEDLVRAVSEQAR